ncbi:MAG: hypothetical protein JWL94_1578 [Microbacteriaceae bacterium]|jgi:hypothetical protein|nr:hypothetical protein [Microbacteriaceae bacterium]
MTLTRSAMKSSITRTVGVGATAALVVGLMLAPQQASAADIPAPDGRSELTAAASCWEAKQRDPAAESGVYWILTPKLGAAEQFYCDQQTDGGGWVLIGRGREGWSTSNEGWGTPAQVRSTVTGQAAFSPRQLPSRTIEALLNGNTVSSLSDGIRLRRATTADGSDWQESTFTFASPRDEWLWQFDNEQRVDTWNIGGTAGTGGQTVGFGEGTLLNRVETFTGSAQGWQTGFGFGSAARGTAASDSYVWAPSVTAPNPRPFTQVYLRPKLMSADTFSTIPDSGTPKLEGRVLADSFALPQVWGVSGRGAGSESIEGSNEVSAFAESNGVMYVGGNFLNVQRSAAGAGTVAQPYLAAFNVASGEFISSFRPVFNNQIKTLEALPNGNIAVGGFFTEVNGQSRANLVVLNPTTGETDPTFSARVLNRLTGGTPTVRALDVQGEWLYVGGNFTHFTWSGSSGERYMRGGARVDYVTGEPVAGFNPEFNGSVMAVDASAQGDRVYFGGFFNRSKTTPTNKGAAIRTADATAIPWTPILTTERGGRGYQQAVLEVGSKVWIGGSQHQLFSYDRSSFTYLSGTVSNPNGDLQAISADGPTIYGGCHCFNTQYQGATVWTNTRNLGTTWTRATKVDSIGAWDQTTGLTLPEFSPLLDSSGGAGSWAQINDSRGVLWTGGDFSYSHRAGFVRQWSGGFVRFARRDATAPTSPSALTAAQSATGVTLNWNGSTDAGSPIEYQVMRNDRVVATTTARTISLPEAAADTKYFVRAADALGNLSASTAAVKLASAPVDPPPAAGDLVGTGSAWKYRTSATAPPAGWNRVGFDSSSWPTGNAPLGFGHSNLGTTLNIPAPKPLASYYSKSVQVTDASRLGSVTLTTRADDGIVVYVNGVEVSRNNMPAGTVTIGTYATSAINATNAVRNPVTITVPGSAFRNGANVIAAEVHLNYRSTPSASFELSAKAAMNGSPPVAARAEPPVDPPADPPAGPPVGTVVVDEESTWSYLFQAEAPAAVWMDPGFDAAAWPTGAAVLGWGASGLGTELTTTVTPKPLSVYFRQSFNLPPGQIPPAGLRLTTRADDGIIVFVNGVEVGRANLPSGPIDHNTYAVLARSTATALASPIAIDIPASALVTGQNVISTQVVSAYRSTPNKTFALTAVVK